MKSFWENKGMSVKSRLAGATNKMRSQPCVSDPTGIKKTIQQRYHPPKLILPLIYEPLNRYETNLCNTVADGVKLLEAIQSQNVVLLADLFHMNIEEENIADALRHGGKHIGHVHFVDSNRRATILDWQAN